MGGSDIPLFRILGVSFLIFDLTLNVTKTTFFDVWIKILIVFVYLNYMTSKNIRNWIFGLKATFTIGYLLITLEYISVHFSSHRLFNKYKFCE